MGSEMCIRDRSKCVDICRVNEATAAQLKDMAPSQTTEQEANAVNQKESSKKPKTTKENCRDPKDQLSAECKFCGYKHERKRDKCPAYGKTCSSCGKANHFAAKWAIQLCVGHTAILPSSEVRNLGRWFDNQLKMVTQINQTCKAAFFHIFNIRKIRKFLSLDTCLLYTSPSPRDLSTSRMPSSA